MSKQSLSINGGSLSNVQLAQTVGNVNQTQTIKQNDSKKIPTPTEIITLIEQLEALLKSSALSDTQKSKVTNHAETIKDEVASKTPDTDYVAKTLRKLLEVDKTITTSQGIWEKTQPIIKEILPWLGVTANFFGF